MVEQKEEEIKGEAAVATQKSGTVNEQMLGVIKDQLRAKAIQQPKYTTVESVEVKMQSDDYIANAMKQLSGVDPIDQLISKTAKNKITDYLKAPNEKVNTDCLKLTIHKQEQQIDTLEKANQAHQDCYPAQKELADAMRRESRTKLNSLIEKYNLVEKVAPQLPKMKKRLSEVEESCREFKNLYRNLCLRDDVLMLTSNLKAEMAMYVDMAQKQWEFEYRKDHSEAMDRFENVLHMTKNITPRIEFNRQLQKQSELSETVSRVEDVLLTGFKAAAHTELDHKLSKDEAENMLELKYDTETALVVESSVTECVMQISDIFEELATVKISMKAIQEQQQSEALRKQNSTTPPNGATRSKRRDSNMSGVMARESKMSSATGDANAELISPSLRQTGLKNITELVNETASGISEIEKRKKDAIEVSKLSQGKTSGAPMSDKGILRPSKKELSQSKSRSSSRFSQPKQPYSPASPFDKKQLKADNRSQNSFSRSSSRHSSKNKKFRDKKPQPIVTSRSPSRDLGIENRFSRTVTLPPNSPMSPANTSAAGKRPQAGIGGLVSSVKEIETRLANLEGNIPGLEERVEEMGELIEEQREQVESNTLAVEQALKRSDDVRLELKEITGGSNNLAAFMESVKRERIKTNAKLDKLVDSLDKMDQRVYQENANSDKLLCQTVKKVQFLDKICQDVSHEVKTTQSWKKQQMKVLVDDVDDLLRNKGDFKQKTDYLFERVAAVQKEVDEKIIGVINEFKSIKSPLMNKVQDIFEASKLYHHEMTRTQNINREMLIDLNRINQEYDSVVEKNTSIENNLNLNLSQLIPQSDPMAMSIFSSHGAPGSQLLQRGDGGFSPQCNIVPSGTFLTGVSNSNHHYNSITNSHDSVAVSQQRKGFAARQQDSVYRQKPMTQAAKTRNNKFCTLQARGSGQGDNMDISMASDSLEKQFANIRYDGSMPSSRGGKRADYKKHQQIKKEGEVLKTLEKRRRTLNQGGRVQNLSMWGATGAEDSIISTSGADPDAAEACDNNNASGGDGPSDRDDSQSPTKNTELRDGDPSIATPMKDANAGMFGSQTDMVKTERSNIGSAATANRSYRGSLTQRGARQSMRKLAKDNGHLDGADKPIMITRLTARNGSNVRNALGPMTSTGFPSVRSKMLKDEDVRGDTLLDVSKFNYSHYIASENIKREKVLAPTTFTLGKQLNSENGSTDAQQMRRQLNESGHQPGSFAEKEAFLLLNKINEINKITNAPKQPCQKLELKRFNEEMSESTSQPKDSITAAVTAEPTKPAAASARGNKTKVPLVITKRRTDTKSIASAEGLLKVASDTESK